MIFGANFNFIYIFLVPQLIENVIEILGLIIEILEDYNHICNLLKIQTNRSNQSLKQERGKTELMNLLIILDVNAPSPDQNNTPTLNENPHISFQHLSRKDAFIFSSRAGISLHHSFTMWPTVCSQRSPQDQRLAATSHCYMCMLVPSCLSISFPVSYFIASEKPVGLSSVLFTYLCLSAPADSTTELKSRATRTYSS